MADKDALFAQFREQTTSLLTPAEAKQVKDILGQFLQDKVCAYDDRCSYMSFDLVHSSNQQWGLCRTFKPWCRCCKRSS
jgi:hypothetical protein